MGKREKLEALKNLDFEFKMKPFHGKYVMNVEGLSFGYDPGAPLIRDFGLNIGARDRVFVIGPNGKGKTTLLKLLAGRLEPDAGTRHQPGRRHAGIFRADQRPDASSPTIPSSRRSRPPTRPSSRTGPASWPG